MFPKQITSKLARCLAGLIQQYPNSTSFWVAYSGGLDSQVLLHALSTLLPTTRLKAIHVNHGLHHNAAHWADICQQNCVKLGIHCEVISVNAKPKRGESPEACARQVRYLAMTKQLSVGDCLVTAHHRDDQAETLLLQLFRGAGLPGLASMPTSVTFGKAYLARPLLPFSRLELQQYAQIKQLNWIEDSSNTDMRFRRNFIRHQLLPALRQHWPSASKTLARVAEHTAEAQKLLEELAYKDWLKVRDLAANKLSVSRLLHLTPARRRNCLRGWLNRLQVSLPSQMQLQQIERLLQSKIDAMPQVNWADIQIRRYRDFLYVLKKETNSPSVDLPIFWDLTQELFLPTVGILTVERKQGQGIDCKKLATKQVIIDFRRGGERFHVQGRLGSHPLKKLFQEWDIPPWQRKKIPLLYCQEELIAVLGYGIHPNFIASSNEWGYVIHLK
jgi:tRNA(Ile)-lysidine synthase